MLMPSIFNDNLFDDFFDFPFYDDKQIVRSRENCMDIMQAI